MADSLVPWVRDYITKVAEEYGSNLSEAPTYVKKKKAQITKFFNYGSEVDDADIWAEASDKQYLIPIKFTKEAVSEYRKTNCGQRLTQHRGAIAVIKDFRPISARVPLVGGQPLLAFECTCFSILGSSGEATFGNPATITSHPDIQLWFDGLNRDGGGGNVLMERKVQREAASKSAVRNNMPPPPIPLPAVVQSAPVDVSVEVKISSMRKTTRDLRSYAAAWQVFVKRGKLDGNKTSKDRSSADYVFEPASEAVPGSSKQVNVSQAVNGTPSPRKEADMARARSATPISNWGSSPMKIHSSPAQNPTSSFPPSSIPPLTLAHLSPVRNPTSSGSSSGPSPSSIPPPTPAQRTRAPSTVTFTPELPLSSYPSLNETTIESEPKSSHSRDTNGRRPVPRKVPRPTSPAPPRGSGPARILAPNSDTSGTQSQSQSISQSQSQSEQHQIASSLDVLIKIRDEEHDVLMDVEDEAFLRQQPEATHSPKKGVILTLNVGDKKRLPEKHGHSAGAGVATDREEGAKMEVDEELDAPTITRDNQIEVQRGILGAVNMNAEDARMNEAYPWLNLWEIKEMMARTLAARRLVIL